MAYLPEAVMGTTGIIKLILIPSSFSKGLQKVILFLPGTYGTSLIKNHSISAPLKELIKHNIPNNVINEIKKSFFGIH